MASRFRCLEIKSKHGFLSVVFPPVQKSLLIYTGVLANSSEKTFSRFESVRQWIDVIDKNANKTMPLRLLDIIVQPQLPQRDLCLLDLLTRNPGTLGGLHGRRQRQRHFQSFSGSIPGQNLVVKDAPLLPRDFPGPGNPLRFMNGRLGRFLSFIGHRWFFTRFLFRLGLGRRREQLQVLLCSRLGDQKHLVGDLDLRRAQRFSPAHGLDVILGWNGTGKSNLFESLVIIFRDLHVWSEKNRWPDNPMNGFRLCYEIYEDNQRRIEDVNGTSGGKWDHFPLCPGSFRARAYDADIRSCLRYRRLSSCCIRIYDK